MRGLLIAVTGLVLIGVVATLTGGEGRAGITIQKTETCEMLPIFGERFIGDFAPSVQMASLNISGYGQAVFKDFCGFIECIERNGYILSNKSGLYLSAIWIPIGKSIYRRLVFLNFRTTPTLYLEGGRSTRILNDYESLNPTNSLLIEIFKSARMNGNPRSLFLGKLVFRIIVSLSHLTPLECSLSLHRGTGKKASIFQL
jgi:hypothetical protein